MGATQQAHEALLRQNQNKESHRVRLSGKFASSAGYKILCKSNLLVPSRYTGG
jgi:hypothetical protein